MSQLSSPLRKAAVLISALDDPAADALLEQMGPEQAAKVRRALMELDEIPADEQQQVLAEFLDQRGSNVRPASVAEADVELAIDEAALERWSQRDSYSSQTPPDGPTSGMEPPFTFLRLVDAEQIAAVLRGEQAQTIAVVVAHLSPEKAAELLERLPGTLATEALERMAWLDQVSPEVCAEVERELRRQLDGILRAAASTPQMLERLTAVLGAMDHQGRQRLVGQLARRNASLAKRLGMNAAPAAHVTSFRYRLETPACGVSHSHRAGASDEARLSFDDLVTLDDAELRAVFAAADPEVVLLALTGAGAGLLSRIVRQLPQRDAAILRQKLDHPGPLRLSDIDAARHKIASLASQLLHGGKPTPPVTPRFAAAV
jgi:flagellar motor switch protein FliG